MGHFHTPLNKSRPQTTAMGRKHRKMSDREAVDALTQQLVETGKREQLKEKLVERLEESGWKDQVKMACRDVVKAKGLDRITVEDLVQEIAPRGSQMVPEEVRKELLRDVKKFLESDPGYNSPHPRVKLFEYLPSF